MRAKIVDRNLHVFGIWSGIGRTDATDPPDASHVENF